MPPQIKQSMQLPKLSSPPPDFLTSMEAYVAEAPRPVAADGEAPAPAKVGKGWIAVAWMAREGAAPAEQFCRQSAGSWAAVERGGPGMGWRGCCWWCIIISYVCLALQPR